MLKSIWDLHDRFINTPLEITTRKNGKVINSVFNRYGLFSIGSNSYPYPSGLLILDFPQANGAFSPSSNTNVGLTLDNKYDEREVFSYSNGRLASSQKKAGTITTYLWSYKGQYPVAEIRNATFAQVQTAFGGSDALNSFTTSEPTDAVVRSKLDPLRTALPSASVSWYTYKPLTGMTSATDPSGRTTYYSYDGFGRLRETKNTQSKTTDTYEYHYRNQ